jgi:hypothetical protein
MPRSQSARPSVRVTTERAQTFAVGGGSRITASQITEASRRATNPARANVPAVSAIHSKFLIIPGFSFKRDRRLSVAVTVAQAC